jgi:membrane protein YqaA with SNARE-associated domain
MNMAGKTGENLTAYLIANFGYVGLFLVSFLAATLLPLGSEAAVVLMATADYAPGSLLAVATMGNSLGALVNYLVGKWGATFILARYIQVDQDVLDRAAQICSRWGAPVLFFAWLPFVGDPLTLAAGVLRVNIYAFTFWVVLGKMARYWILITTAVG